MIAIGILLILVVAALVVGIVLNGGETATIEAFNVEVTASVTGFFAIGAGAAIVAVIGLWFVVAGVSRSRRRKREMERLRRQADSAAARERATEEEADAVAPAGPIAMDDTASGTEATQPPVRPADEPATDAYGTAMPPEPAPRPAPEAGPTPIPGQPTGDREDQPNADWGSAHR